MTRETLSQWSVMKIEKSKYVTMTYSLSLDGGEEIEKSDPSSPLGFVHGFGFDILKNYK